jgi:ribonuclease Y
LAKAKKSNQRRFMKQKMNIKQTWYVEKKHERTSQKPSRSIGSYFWSICRWSKEQLVESLKAEAKTKAMAHIQDTIEEKNNCTTRS